MFIKSASTNTKKFTRIFFLSCVLVTACLHGFVREIQGKDSPNLSEPFKKCLVYGTGNGLSKIVASDNVSNLILTTDNYSLASINPSTGLENWKSQTGGRLEGDTVTDETSLFFITSYESENKDRTYILNSVSLKTGTTNWQKKFTDGGKISLQPIVDKDIIFILAGEKSICTILKSDGNTIWTKDFPFRIFAIETIKPGLISVLLENRLIRVFIKTGEILAEAKLKKESISSFIANESYILFGYVTGEIIKAAPSENKIEILWKIKAGAGISGLSEYHDGVLVTSLDNFIYLYSMESGKLRWKKRVAGRINIKPLIIGEFAVVASSGDNSASVFDMRDGKVVNQIQVETDNYFSGQPQAVGRYIIFQTFKGTYFFVNTNVSCK
jgi:outer membrane protein assembly factor BamB